MVLDLMTQNHLKKAKSGGGIWGGFLVKNGHVKKREIAPGLDP